MENKNIYVGHRYVPKIMGEHDSTQSYEGLPIVTHEGTSYTSKKHVPVGVDISNEEYWVVTGNYNVQVENYRTEVNRFKTDINKDMKQMYDDFEEVTNSKTDLIDNNLTIKVPEDISTITKAIEYVSNKYISKDKQIDILISDDYIISENIYLENNDYSNITLKANKILSVSDNFKGILLRGVNCKLPNFNILVDMKDKGTNGLSIEDNSDIFIRSNSGILNSGGTCVIVRSSRIRGSYCKFEGGNNRNVWITRASVASLPECSFDNCKGGLYAVYVSRGSIADFSGSTINNSNATTSALHVLRSRVTFIQSEILNCASNAVHATQSSSISCRDIVVKDCTGHGISSSDTSTIDVYEGVIENCRLGLNATTVGLINGANTNITGCYRGVSCSHGATINVNNAIIKNNDLDIYLYSGGIVTTNDTETTSGINKIEDTSQKSFNKINRQGIIFNGTIEVTENYVTGTYTGVTTTGGISNVQHSLGKRPKKVNFYLYGENKKPLIIQLIDIGSTSLQLKFFNPDGTIAGSQEYTVYYEVGE